MIHLQEVNMKQLVDCYQKKLNFTNNDRRKIYWVQEVGE